MITRANQSQIGGARLVLALSTVILSLTACFLVPPATSANARREPNPEALKESAKSEYKARRQSLMQRVKDGLIVVLGARMEDETDIETFRQKNNLMYLTGVEAPNAFLILVPEGLIPGKPGQEILFVPSRDPSQEMWTGPQIGPGDEGRQAYGVDEVAPSENFYSRLFQILTTPPFKGRLPGQQFQPKIYVNLQAAVTAMTTREREFMDVILRTTAYVPLFNLSPELNELRKIKSASEVELIQKAVDITAEGMRAASTTIKPGVYEYEVQAEIEATFMRHGAERTSFASIIGSGFNSTVIHYNRNKKKIEAGDLVVVDIGAENKYYTGDLSRTFPASGKFTPRQREIYQLVLDTQRAVEKAFVPNQTTIGQLQMAAVEFMKASPLRDKEGNPLDKYFLHGVGHWLGMEVHDVGDYSKPIPVGAVFTIEPGIYIQFEKIGVRIEDNYLVTGDGLVKLSRRLPSDPAEVEKMMSPATTSMAEKQPKAKQPE